MTSFYERNRERQLALVRQRYQEAKSYMDAIKVEHGCIDCGYNQNAAALTFDHVDPYAKTRAVGMMKTYSRTRIDAEIEKCVVRCSNCHAIRSDTEQHWRVRVGAIRKSQD